MSFDSMVKKAVKDLKSSIKGAEIAQGLFVIAMKKVVKKEAPQPVIMTQIGLMNCLSKTEGTQIRSLEHIHGYTKRHGTRTSNRLSTDK